MTTTKTRTGARSFLDEIKHACKLSHTPGFKAGLDLILGPDASADLYGLWTPLCTLVESMMALDDWWDKKDATEPSLEGSEDAVLS